MTRTALCQSLVKNGARVIRDGADHSSKANRCLDASGKCVGFYAVLISYHEPSDTFTIGWQQAVKAACVDEVAIHDLLEELARAIEQMRNELNKSP